MAEPDDERERDLLAAWCAGDDAAGEQLAALYFTPLRSFFVRRAPEEYEDLVQQTYLKIAGTLANYRGEGSVRAFFYGIARNVLLHYLRKVGRQPDFDPASGSLLDAYGRRPSSILTERESHRIMLDALQEIPSKYQDLLELYYWQGLTAPELARALDIPVGTVRSRISYAIDKLRSKFCEISERPSTVTVEQLTQWMGEYQPG